MIFRDGIEVGYGITVTKFLEAKRYIELNCQFFVNVDVTWFNVHVRTWRNAFHSIHAVMNEWENV